MFEGFRYSELSSGEGLEKHAYKVALVVFWIE